MEYLRRLWHCSTPGDGKAAQVRAQRSVRGCGRISLSFPALSREIVPGLGLPRGGSDWAGRSPGRFNVSSRWFSFNAFNSVCFPFPLGWFDRRGLIMGPACMGTPVGFRQKFHHWPGFKSQTRELQTEVPAALLPGARRYPQSRAISPGSCRHSSPAPCCPSSRAHSDSRRGVGRFTRRAPPFPQRAISRHLPPCPRTTWAAS